MGSVTAFTLQIAAYVRALGLVEGRLHAARLAIRLPRAACARCEVIGLEPLMLKIARVLNGGGR